MKQQINLYQPQKKDKPSSFNSRSSLSILAVALIALISLTLMNDQQLATQKQQLAELQKQRQQLQNEFAQVVAEQSEPDDSPLAKEVAMLKIEVSKAEQRKALLKGLKEGKDPHWAPVFTQALAAQTEQNQLLNLSLEATETSLTLAGSTQQAAALSDFLSSAAAGSTQELTLSRKGSQQQYVAVIRLTTEATQ